MVGNLNKFISFSPHFRHGESSSSYKGDMVLEYLGQACHESGHLTAADYLEEIICISFLY